MKRDKQKANDSLPEPRKQFNHRLPVSVIKRIETLAREWHCSQVDVVIRLVIDPNIAKVK